MVPMCYIAVVHGRYRYKNLHKCSKIGRHHHCRPCTQGGNKVREDIPDNIWTQNGCIDTDVMGGTISTDRCLMATETKGSADGG